MLLFGGIPLLLIVAVVAVLIAGNTSSSVGLVNADKLNPGSQLLKVGTKAPDFTLSTVDGTPYRLSSFKGKPVLLEFFAVWCPHCQRESTILNQIDHNFGSSQHLQTLAILASPYGKNYDTSGGNDLSIVTKSDMNWFEQTFAVAHPTLIEPNFTSVNAYNASSYPSIYVLDKQGIIRYANSGEQPYADLANAITAAAKTS
jgi:cytochrome c biogenesis protein CcmG/thiol:disulfide interchange protein DsbE